MTGKTSRQILVPKFHMLIASHWRHQSAWFHAHPKCDSMERSRALHDERLIGLLSKPDNYILRWLCLLLVVERFDYDELFKKSGIASLLIGKINLNENTDIIKMKILLTIDNHCHCHFRKKIHLLAWWINFSITIYCLLFLLIYTSLHFNSVFT